MLKNVTDTVFYVGVDDKDIDLFENQYIVPNGIAYNSYVIMDEKIAIMDMVDAKCADQWFANVAEVLGDRQPDYLIISHLEPDHSANLGDVLAKYPDIKIVSNAKLFAMLPNFFEVPVADRSRHSDNLTHHSGSPHHADCTQGYVCHADIPSSHEQVVNVAGVKAPVRHSIVIDSVAYAYRFEFLSREPFPIFRIRIMKVYIPGCGDGAILIRNPFLYILLGKDMVSDQSS